MNRERRHVWLLTLLAAVWLAAGCGGPRERGAAIPEAPPPTAEHWPGPAVCDLMPGEVQRGGDLVLAVADSVVPGRAPVPVTPGERVVFANLYETLTRVDCSGVLHPGLATRWREDDDGRHWTFTLREGARFWDGGPVTAEAVIDAWRRNQEIARRLGRPCPGVWLDARDASLRALDSGRLAIQLPEPQPDLPRLLAHPALAVARLRPGWTWPVGSGPCRLAADTGEPLPDLVCRPHLWSAEPPRWRTFTFRCRPGADARDLLTAGVDLAVLRQEAATAFYAGMPDVQSAPLPWDRLHLLAIPPGASLDVLAVARRSELTGEAIAAEARPWASLFFHGCVARPCPQLAGPAVPAGPTPPEEWDPAAAPGATGAVVCAATDPAARALGERLAAFVGGQTHVEPLPPGRFAARLEAGRDAGYVLTVDACYPDACLTLAALLARAGWLQRAATATDPCAAADRLVARGVVVPLAETRARLVWRGPLAGLRLAHDGTPLVAGLGVAP